MKTKEHRLYTFAPGLTCLHGGQEVATATDARGREIVGVTDSPPMLEIETPDGALFFELDNGTWKQIESDDLPGRFAGAETTNRAPKF